MLVQDKFERVWFAIFMLLYLLMALPFPWNFNTKYVPSLWGVPVFIYGWLIQIVIVIVSIIIFSKMCLKRKEYYEFDLESED